MGPRLAEHQDLGAIHALVEEAYSPYIARMGKRPGPMDDDYATRIAAGQAWVFTDEDGSVVGLLVLEDHGRFTLIDNMVVAEAARGQGISRTLMDFAAHQAREAGHQELQLYTHALMHENRALYGHLGWEVSREVQEKGFDRIYFRKAI